MRSASTQTLLRRDSRVGAPAGASGSDTVVYAAGITAGSFAALLGIAAGSMLFYGLMVRAQPGSHPQAKEAGPPNRSGRPYTKRSNKLLVMRATAR